MPEEPLKRIERRLDEIQTSLLKNGWGEWGKKVLSDLETFEKRLNTVPSHQNYLTMERELTQVITQLQKLDERVDGIKEDLVMIRTKLDNKVNKADFRELKTEMKSRAGLIGGIAGAIIAIAGLLWNYFKP